MFKLSNLKSDFIASIVVFLVAIPLCLGIALASGAPLFSGIVTGIIGGIVVGLFSDSHVSVSGPAAGMIAVVLGAIAALGSFHAFLLALFIAGFLQILIGVFRAGFLAEYIPLNVIQGLLAAIGIVIIIKQLPLAFGYFGDVTSLYASLKTSEEIFSFAPLVSLIKNINIGATIVTLVSFFILIFWPKIKLKQVSVIPSAIVVVVFAVVLNQLFSFLLPVFALKSSHLVNIPVNETWLDITRQFQHPQFSDWANYDVYIYAVTIAIVASLETLLNIEAAEKIDPHRRRCSKNRELVAQGVGNSLSGLLGGLPITSVIIRSTVNIHAGGKSKCSTIFHGVLLFCALALVPSLLNQIPLAALAAILIFTGYKLARASLFREMYAQGFAYFFPFIVTIVAIVFSNLLTGVLIGLGVSFFFILWQNSRRQFMTIIEKHPGGDVLRLMLPQQATFLSKVAMVETLERIEKKEKVILDANSTDYIDNDILDVIKNFKEYQAVDKGISLNLEGFKEHYEIKNQTNFVNVSTCDLQSNLTPQAILSILKEGNQRFLNNISIHKNYAQQIAITSKSQHPMVVILSCIDSRVPVELIFDLNLGDAFVVRVAGNVINEDILASIEFGCHVAGAKLVVVLGHKRCGAIQAACDHVQFGHVTQLIKKIEPALEAETQTKTNRTGNNEDFVANVATCNVEVGKKALYERSEVLRQLLDEKQIGLVGAIYDVKTGSIAFEED